MSTTLVERLQFLADSVVSVNQREAVAAVRVEVESAIQCLREIAAMGKKAGSEAAQHWLLQHGYPLEDGGYVPGRGFLGEP